RPAQAGIALNFGSLPALLRQVERRAEALAVNGRRITIVGHSLGGIFARVIAARRPDLVQRAITLGAPLIGDPRRTAHPAVQAIARILLHGDDDALIAE
ncbi:MAG: esterase/lipase family protein, partial [Dehalococcoidia bacterium]